MAEPVPEVKREDVDTEVGPVRPSRRVDPVLGSVVLLAVAAVVVTILVGRETSADDRRQAETDATAVATKVVEAMTSVDAKDVDANLGVVKDNSGGEFADQFESQRAAYVEAVTKAGVSAVGDVVESGVVNADDDKVVLLLAVSATITNKEVPDGDQRAYRMRVTTLRDGGSWKVTKLELVA